MVGWDHAAGLEFDFGDADAVFHEEDVLRAAVEDVEAAFLVPWKGRRFAGLLVLQKLDGHVAEGSVREVAGEVGEVGGEEAGVAVGEGDFDGGLALDFVGDVGGAEHDVDVVVTVTVDKGRFVRGDFEVEDAHVVVGEDKVVMGLGGDFDFGLRGEEDRAEDE